MSGFEFFFTFYGLVLGLAVAELLGGLSRVIHERVRPGLLTTLLALFVAIDAATFWNQAWTIFRQAPYNFALLIVGLMIAGAFFVAATLVFPREPRAGMNLDDHFWRHRRTVLLCLLAANLTVAAVFMGVAGLSGDMPAGALSARFWIGFGLFTACTIIAAMASGRRIVTAALSALLLYYVYQIGLSTVRVVEAGAWPMG